MLHLNRWLAVFLCKCVDCLRLSSCVSRLCPKKCITTDSWRLYDWTDLLLIIFNKNHFPLHFKHVSVRSFLIALATIRTRSHYTVINKSIWTAQTSAKADPLQIRSPNPDEFQNLMGLPYPKIHLCRNFMKIRLVFPQPWAKWRKMHYFSMAKNPPKIPISGSKGAI